MKKKYKILIVEDSMTAMLYTTNIVREAGHDPVEAINGKEALQKLRNDSFDMIISDILMPEMDGFQLLKHVKEDPDLRNIPFIFHTATYNSDKDKDFGVKLGVDAYIHKFKNPTELSQLIQDVFKELELGKFISNKPKIKQEEDVFKLYSERLINKLEKKILDLEKEIIEHKKTEEDLKQFEKIVDSTSSHMSFIDTNYVYQEVNNSYIIAHKKKREEVVGHTIADILGNEVFENVIKDKIDTCFTGEIIKYENWFNFNGIRKRYMQVSYYPYYNEENKISGVIVDSIDITERKQAETKLANKTMLLDNITNRASNISIITTDLDLKIISYNPFAEKFFGYSAKQVIGKTVHEMHFMENIEPERLTKAFKIVNKTGEYNYNVKQQLPGGKRVLSSRVTKILNPDGKLAGYSLFTHDVTKQVLAEEKLLQRENYLKALNKTNELLIGEKPNVQLQKFAQIIGEAAHSSRTYIFKNHKDENGNLLLSQIAEYVGNGIKPEIDNPELQNLSYKNWLPRWQNTLSKGNIINGKVAQFPKSEREILEPQDIKALLVIPIMIEKEFWGFIGFDNCISDDEWQTAEIEYLKASAEKISTKIKEHRKQVLLENENKRFHATMDSIDAVVYVADMQTHELLFLNKYGKKYWGDKIGQKCYVALQGLDKPCGFCTNHLLLDKNGNPKKPYVWEFQNTITKQWYQLRDQAVQWTDGRLVRSEIATDITERKISENQLIESKKFTENLLETANSIIITLDTKANITTFNKHIEQLTGYKKEEVLGKNWFDVFIPDRDKKSIPKVFKKALDAMPETSQYQNPIIIKSGEERLISWSNNLIYDNQGNKNGLLSIGDDITEREKAEKKLIESEEKYKNFVNHSPDIIYKYSNKSGGLFWSNKVEDILGFSPDEIISDPFIWHNSIHPDDKENVQKAIEDNKKGADYNIEYRIKTKQGKWIWLHDYFMSFWNNSGRSYRQKR
ncbi:MAG: hypothetical protein B6D64_08805 [Bacteroidetes bacterium 4484_276]|nr:MAG: hypothetical protein B6D64_08805 [Bacteroidetes bacterium 4484_276]